MNQLKRQNEIKVRRRQYWTLADVVRVYDNGKTLEEKRKELKKHV